MEFLDDDWLAAAAAALAELPVVEGVDVVIDHVITGSPGGKVTVGATVERGRVTRLEAAPSDDPDVVISLDAAGAVAILTGARSADAAYMDGSLKVEGDHPRWLLDLRETRAAARAALAPVVAATDPLG